MPPPVGNQRDPQRVRRCPRSSNPNLDTERIITELGTGEALVSVLQRKGDPSPVERTRIRPPVSKIGPITKALRNQVIASSDGAERYSKAVDRKSAYEKLKTRTEDKQLGMAEEEKSTKKSKPKRSSSRQSIGEAMIKSVVRAIGSNIGRQFARGIMGSLFGKR